MSCIVWRLISWSSFVLITVAQAAFIFCLTKVAGGTVCCASVWWGRAGRAGVGFSVVAHIAMVNFFSDQASLVSCHGLDACALGRLIRESDQVGL